MAKAAINLQDSFLNQVRRDSSEVKMILLDGSALIGVVRGFDNFTVIVSSRSSQHLVYKHAIAQIIQRRAAGRREDAAEGEEIEAGESTPHAPRPAAEAPARKGPFNPPIDLSGLKPS